MDSDSEHKVSPVSSNCESENNMVGIFNIQYSIYHCVRLDMFLSVALETKSLRLFSLCYLGNNSKTTWKCGGL